MTPEQAAKPLDEEEWDRIRAYIAAGPETTYLDSTAEGTCVIYAGGVIHPRFYLDIMDDPDDGDNGVDILKRTQYGRMTL